MLAKCTPGQNGIPADSGLFVFLHPLGGLPGGFGTVVGTITISSNENNWSDGMDVVMAGDEPAWHPYQIGASFPASSGGTGTDTERFRIEINAGGRTYVADNVDVAGPEDSGWPPTHDPGGTLVIQPVLSLVTLSQDRRPINVP